MRDDFQRQKDKDLQDFEEWKKEERKKIQNEKKVAERNKSIM